MLKSHHESALLHLFFSGKNGAGQGKNALRPTVQMVMLYIRILKILSNNAHKSQNKMLHNIVMCF